jgi:hypothetical protein
MDRQRCLVLATVLMLSGCGGASPEPATPAQASTIASAVSADPELAQLQIVPPVDACAALTPAQLERAYPGLRFEVRQKLEPQLSGYAWDSRCTYWAGVGTLAFAKDVPSHTVEIFVATPVSAAKARANLAARRANALSSTGYQPLPELGADAYATSGTGLASVFFVRGASEVQINVSDLESTIDQKLGVLRTLARAT